MKLFEILMKVNERVFTVTLTAENRNWAVMKAAALVKATFKPEILQITELS